MTNFSLHNFWTFIWISIKLVDDYGIVIDCKFCARWVPKKLTDITKQGIITALNFIDHSNDGGDKYLDRIMIGWLEWDKDKVCDYRDEGTDQRVDAVIH